MLEREDDRAGLEARIQNAEDAELNEMLEAAEPLD